MEGSTWRAHSRGAEEVQVDVGAPLVGPCLEERFESQVGGHPRVVHEDVDGSESSGHSGHAPGHGLVVGHVEAGHHHRISLVGQGVGSALGPVRM